MTTLILLVAWTQSGGPEFRPTAAVGKNVVHLCDLTTCRIWWPNPDVSVFEQEVTVMCRLGLSFSIQVGSRAAVLMSPLRRGGTAMTSCWMWFVVKVLSMWQQVWRKGRNLRKGQILRVNCLNGGRLVGLEIVEAMLESEDKEVEVERVEFEGMKLDGIILDGIVLDRVELEGMKLDGVELGRMELDGMKLDEVELEL